MSLRKWTELRTLAAAFVIALALALAVQALTMETPAELQQDDVGR